MDFSEAVLANIVIRVPPCQFETRFQESAASGETSYVETGFKV